MSLCVTGIFTGPISITNISGLKMGLFALTHSIRMASKGLIQTYVCTYLTLLSPMIDLLLLLMVSVNG